MVKFQKKNTLNIFYIRGGEDPNVKILHFFFIEGFSYLPLTI